MKRIPKSAPGWWSGRDIRSCPSIGCFRFPPLRFITLPSHLPLAFALAPRSRTTPTHHRTRPRRSAPPLPLRHRRLLLQEALKKLPERLSPSPNTTNTAARLTHQAHARQRRGGTRRALHDR